MLFLLCPQTSRRLEGTPGLLIWGKFELSVFTEELQLTTTVRLAGPLNPCELSVGSEAYLCQKEKGLPAPLPFCSKCIEVLRPGGWSALLP